jgi:molybdate transport system substrate-binding protein
VRSLPLALALAACSSGTDHKQVRVAAAADLARAFEEVGRAFHAKTGIEPLFTFGSSGMLAKQIENSAPYYLFAAANLQYAEDVAAAGRCDKASITPYARGRLAVWTPDGVVAPKTFAELADPRFAKIAIADPEHAPYGKAAQQALEKAGLWDKVKDKLVLGDNVQATLRFAQTKNADAAIVALSLASVSDGGAALQVDPALHAPLDQSLIVCGTGEEAAAARQLVQFINSTDGREIMTRYGFLLPNEQMSRKP